MTNSQNTNNDKIKKTVYSIAEMISIVEKEPKPNMIYSGIKEGSLGFVFGPSKSGKSTYCEALGMSIACGAKEFLGLPIGIKGAKVLSISLEEYYHNRTERNTKQINALVETYGTKWLEESYVVIKDEIPRHIETHEDWDILIDTIVESKADVVIIDSLTRLYAGKIEDSSIAKEIMKRLRHLADVTKTTVICIHHTSKMYDKPISLDTLAGSRVIGQEADFMIGINKSPGGQRYIKEVAFRYAQSNDNTVQQFEIDENNWIVPIGNVEEYKLLAPKDGRSNPQVDKTMMELFQKNDIVTTEMLKCELINKEGLSKAAMYKRLKKNKNIESVGNGKYTLKEK